MSKVPPAEKRPGYYSVACETCSQPARVYMADNTAVCKSDAIAFLEKGLGWRFQNGDGWICPACRDKQLEPGAAATRKKPKRYDRRTASISEGDPE